MHLPLRVIVCLYGAAISLAAQEPAPADPVIRVSVDLVQVDAVVKDSAGRHVRNLRADEFEILEDGKPQKITHFSFVPGGVPASGGVSLPPAALLTRGQVQRTVVLLADDLGISAESMPRVKKALANVVDERLLPGDLVSLMASSGGTGALQQFTSDRRQLHAALDRIHWFRGGRGVGPFKQLLDADPVIAAKATQYHAATEGMADLVEQHYRYGTLAAIHYAIQGMRQMPGRKALVLLTEGVGLDTLLDGVIDEANRAGVAIYPVDVRGVVYTGLGASDRSYARAEPVSARQTNLALSFNASDRGRINEYENSQRGLAKLAGETGGVFLEKDNDVGALLAAAVEEIGDFYLIGYQPQRQDYGTKFHRIQIRVKPRGLRVTSRSGFLGAPSANEAALPKAREMQLATALMSPFQGAIPTPLTLLYGPGGKDPKTGRREVVLRGQVVLDANALEFVKQPNGRHRVVLDAVAAAYGADGKVVASQDRTFTADLDDAELQATRAQGLFYGALLTLPKAGAYQIRIALRDAGTGKTGSANRFLQVPDFDRPNLTLASLVLADNVTRQYEAGAPMAFRCDAFGVVSSVLGFEVRLYRGSERIYSGPVLKMQAQDVAKQMSVAGTLRLPETLPSGDYVMELVVRDDLRTATQWAEFTLAGK